jgi:hypothetical protein
MVELFEEGIRGGVSFAGVRSMETTEDRALVYLDAVNLYGFGLSSALPVDDFRWMTKEELARFDFGRRRDEGEEEGYCFVVDASVPESLHAKQRQLPLLPEHRTLGYEDLSPYSRRVYRETRGLEENEEFKYESPKLVGSLLPKKRYLAASCTLQHFVSQGGKIDKVHSGIRFAQKRVLKPYIDHCSKLRRLAKSPFKKRLLKYVYM